MKKITLLFAVMTISLLSAASELVMIPTGSLEKTKEIFNLKELTVHFYNDKFAIGTIDNSIGIEYIVLDENAWANENSHYFLLYFDQASRDNYIESVTTHADILHHEEDFLVVSTESGSASGLYPAVHGGIVQIANTQARFPSNTLGYRSGSLSFRNYIDDLLNEVSVANLQETVQQLQDYGSRNAYEPGGIQAQNWIFSQFESYGLSVELHDFNMPSGPASDNVIATLTGTEYPDEYIVLGAHYDSYAYGSNEPGADDNATGTAGILEIARILSQYEFDRSIIFATWSGEEYGLYGSAAWASQAASSGMNILGYFNIDMAGYLQPGSYIHTDVIGPASASELKQFYTDVCAIYLPEFIIEPGALSGGDSDHTSFNNNGFQGIFPFEDSQNYSPYIHTSNDLIGPSVNNFEQHGLFVKATLASVVSLSDMLPSPQSLVALAGDGEVGLSWIGVENVDYFNIYRNLEPVPYATAQGTSYLDNSVINGTPYTYYVTAVFLNTGEESGPSNLVSAIPMPPIALPFFDDFETGAPYWTMDDTWGLRSGFYYSPDHSITESPSGNYQNNMNSSLTLRSIDLTGASGAELSFWCRYSLQNNYDYIYLEISANGGLWEQLASFTGSQSAWTQKSYSLNNYLDQPNVKIRFRLISNNTITADGMHIDDLEILVTGVGIGEDKSLNSKNTIHLHPNPAGDYTTIDYKVSQEGVIRLSLFDANGRLVNTLAENWTSEGIHSVELNLAGLQSGIYQVVFESNGQQVTRKLVVSR